ncbi:MAG: hypothetical protein PHX60_15935 [Giesbergeria sp.]|nr:hypothetical protein [Giesbergeria sp.]
MEALKRDFPRLAGQEELLKMMTDVYAENPGFLQNLVRKLENEERKGKHGKPPGPDPRFEAGELKGAVKVISPTEVENAEAATEHEHEHEQERAAGAQEGDRGAGEESDTVSALGAQ